MSSKSQLNNSGLLSQKSEYKSDVTMQQACSQQSLIDLFEAMNMDGQESNAHMEGDSQVSDYLNVNKQMEIFGNFISEAHGLQAYLKKHKVGFDSKKTVKP